MTAGSLVAVLAMVGVAWSPSVGWFAAGHPKPSLLALTITLALAAGASYAVVLNLVPLLTERGMTTTTAAVVLGIGGAGQVPMDSIV